MAASTAPPRGNAPTRPGGWYHLALAANRRSDAALMATPPNQQQSGTTNAGGGSQPVAMDRYLTSAWRLLRALWATSFRKFCFLLFLPCPAPGLSSEWCSCTGAPAEVYVLRKRAS
nr:bisphosphoglycerate mutase isoform X3 [Columba livia]